MPHQLEAVTGRNFTEIRVGGGGSRSELFCQTLATVTGLKVTKGAAECTVQGNLSVQFAAQKSIGY